MSKLTQELRDAIASNNTESIRAKVQELKAVLGEISTAAYQSAGAGAGPSAGPAGAAAGPEAGGFAGGSGGGMGGGGGTAAGPNPSP